MTACTTNTCAAPTKPNPRFSVLHWFSTVFALRSQRRKLSDLDDHLLSDIGMTRSEAKREAARKPWDVPQHWLQ